VHNASELAGPVYVFVVALMYGTGLLSLYVLIDSLRPGRAGAFARAPRMRWLWTVPQALYFVLFVIENLPWVGGNATLATLLVILTIPALIHQFAYLLRVVYPHPSRLMPADSDTIPAEDRSAASSD